MTEAAWIACTDAMLVFDFFRRKASDRKMRLFAVACCRRIWHLLSDERSRMAVQAAEAYADGLVTRKELVHARDEARKARRSFQDSSQVYAWRAATAAQDATRDVGRSAALNAAGECSRCLNQQNHNECSPPELQQQCALLRCIFNPFRPAAVDTTWLTWKENTVPKIARAIYDDRSFAHLPILADALEEAGCDNADILAHCRSGSEHVRGCWVLDLLLGKE